jgi:hypothetical protein
MMTMVKTNLSIIVTGTRLRRIDSRNNTYRMAEAPKFLLGCRPMYEYM